MGVGVIAVLLKTLCCNGNKYQYFTGLFRLPKANKLGTPFLPTLINLEKGADTPPRFLIVGMANETSV